MALPLKFSFSEKARKICAIYHLILTFMYLVNVKTMRKIAQFFVAFSEKLYFIEEYTVLTLTIAIPERQAGRQASW